MKHFFSCIALVSFVIVAANGLNAQTSYGISMIHYYNNRPSFNARFLQFGMAVLGMKHAGERRFKKRQYGHKAAPVPAVLKRKYNATVTDFQGRRVWTFKPHQNASGKVILYLHGGSYVANILSFHWDLIEQLLAKTNATVVVPDYPLAPDATCPQVLDYVKALYQQLLTDTDAKNINIMGDSAGGGLALSTALQLKADTIAQPGNIILLSPWLDVSMVNPDIAAVDKKDKMLGIPGLIQAGKAYAGSLSTTDSRVSPVYGSFEGLGKISVFIGTHDVLLPDCRKLQAMLSKEGIAHNYYEYAGLFHVWMAVTSLKESKHTVAEIAQLLK